jgi:hypothetical protein
MKSLLFDPPSSLSAELNTMKIPAQKEVVFALDKNQDWLKELLFELNADAPGMPAEIAFGQTTLNLELKLSRKSNAEFNEYILLDVKLDALFFTQCVKTLTLMKDDLSFEFKACFIDISFEKQDEYEDLTEFYIDNEMRDLYYYEKRLINLCEVIREQIFLNKNPYPTRKQ